MACNSLQRLAEAQRAAVEAGVFVQDALELNHLCFEPPAFLVHYEHVTELSSGVAMQACPASLPRGAACFTGSKTLVTEVLVVGVVVPAPFALPAVHEASNKTVMGMGRQKHGTFDIDTEVERGDGTARHRQNVRSDQVST